MPLLELNWPVIGSHVLHLAIAYLIVLPIGLEREHSAPGPGLRTYPLVAMGACGYLLVGQQVLEGSDSHARMLYGLMTGLGFIGGGAILKDNDNITGTATAASVWTTGAVGAAVAWGRYEIAIALVVVNFLTLWLGGKVRHVTEPFADKK